MKLKKRIAAAVLVMAVLFAAQLPSFAAEPAAYVLGNEICDAEGIELEGYKVDTAGNIIDSTGAVAVPAKEVKNFAIVSEIEFDSSLLWNIEYLTEESIADYTNNNLKKIVVSETEYDEIYPIAALDAYGTKYTHPVDVDVIISTPQNAIYTALIFTSNDPVGFFFRDTERCSVDKDGEILHGEAKISPSEDGKYHLLMTALFDGEFKLYVTGYEGIRIGEINIGIVPVDADKEQNPAVCSDLTETVVEPTEFADGYTMKGCKEHGWFTRNSFTKYEAPACEHKLSYYASVPATYTAEGCNVYVCELCGEKTYSEYTEKLICPGHTGGKATCAAKAVCDICNQPYGETTGKHSFTAATCTDASRCTVCGGFGGAELGHDWEVLSTSKATCTAGGGDSVLCRRCGTVAAINQTAPLGHDYNAMEYTLMPACDTEGTRSATCRTCGNIITETVPALGHSWQDITATVHHDAVTQEIKVIDQAEVPGWDETQQVSICICSCGASFSSRDGWAAHSSSYIGTAEDASHSSYSNTMTTSTIHHDGSPEIFHMETVTVQEAYDEIVVTGHICTVCGISG